MIHLARPCRPRRPARRHSGSTASSPAATPCSSSSASSSSSTPRNLLLVTAGSRPGGAALGRAGPHALRHHRRRRRDHGRARDHPRDVPPRRAHRPHRGPRPHDEPDAGEDVVSLRSCGCSSCSRPSPLPSGCSCGRGEPSPPAAAVVTSAPSRCWGSSSAVAPSGSLRHRHHRETPARRPLGAAAPVSDQTSGARGVRRRARRARHPGLHGVVPARRPPLRPVRRHRLALRGRHAAPRPVGRPRPRARRLGDHGLVLVAAHRPRQRAPAARRAAYKAFLVTRVADIGMVVGIVALSVAGPVHRPRGGAHGRRATSTLLPSGSSVSSSVSPASRASCRSTTGSPTRWRARPRRRPSSTPRRWSRPAPTSSRASSALRRERRSADAARASSPP